MRCNITCSVAPVLVWSVEARAVFALHKCLHDQTRRIALRTGSNVFTKMSCRLLSSCTCLSCYACVHCCWQSVSSAACHTPVCDADSQHVHKQYSERLLYLRLAQRYDQWCNDTQCGTTCSYWEAPKLSKYSMTWLVRCISRSSLIRCLNKLHAYAGPLEAARFRHKCECQKVMLRNIMLHKCSKRNELNSQ